MCKNTGSVCSAHMFMQNTITVFICLFEEYLISNALFFFIKNISCYKQTGKTQLYSTKIYKDNVRAGPGISTLHCSSPIFPKLTITFICQFYYSTSFKNHQNKKYTPGGWMLLFQKELHVSRYFKHKVCPTTQHTLPNTYYLFLNNTCP